MKLNLRFIIITLGLVAMCGFGTMASVPNGYYTSIYGKKGTALKTAIHDVIRPHTKLTYASLWNHFPSTDVYPEQINGKWLVWDMYSDNKTNQIYYYPNGTSGLNREHSCPKSWWGGDQNEAYTDINHLYPSDAKANTAKNNYPLGVVKVASFNNGVSKVGTPQSGMGGGCQSVFEPADEYKGDFARTYFYMATMYQDYTWKYTYMFSNSSDLTLSQWAYTLLLEWARQDPVSDKEIDRNEAVFLIQNNRNPFIDIPGLEEYIWGNKQGQVLEEGGGEVSGDPELIYPAVGSTIDFGEVALGKTVALDVVIKAANLTNNLKIKVYGTNSDQFAKLPVNEITRNAANQGYTLKVTYSPNALGDHTARLLFYDGGLPETGVGVTLTGSCQPVPTLSAVVATDPINVTENSFTATWCLAEETVDSYNVNHIVYNGSQIITDETIPVPVDDLDESTIGMLDFGNLAAGYTHTYRVQSCRLGCTSEWSNTITFTTSGIDEIEAFAPISVESYVGGVIVRCSDNYTGISIYNMQGMLVRRIAAVEDGEFIELPVGNYIIVSDHNPNPVRASVR